MERIARNSVNEQKQQMEDQQQQTIGQLTHQTILQEKWTSPVDAGNQNFGDRGECIGLARGVVKAFADLS